MTSITSFKVVLVFFVSMCSSLEALDFGSLKKKSELLVFFMSAVMTYELGHFELTMLAMLLSMLGFFCWFSFN
jgi:hypothetical protein